MKILKSILVGLALASVVLAQQATQEGRGGRGAAIEPRILTFEARPGTIRPGESAQLVWQTEKNLKEWGDKLDSETRNKVKAAVARVKEALKGNNVTEIQSASDALTQTWHQAASQMYQKTAQGQAESGQSEPSPGDSDNQEPKSKGGPVDADFEVVN